MRTVPTGAMVNRGLVWRGFREVSRDGPARDVKGCDKDGLWREGTAKEGVEKRRREFERERKSQ